MPTTKPRITVTLEPRTYAVLARLSRLGDDSMSSLVAQFVDLAVPSMERLAVALEGIKGAPEEIRAGLAASIERAERTLMPALQAAADQRDLFLADVEAAARQGTAVHASGGAAQRGRRKGAPTAPEGRSTPVRVTRGSGGGKTLTRGRSKGGGRGAL